MTSKWLKFKMIIMGAVKAEPDGYTTQSCAATRPMQSLHVSSNSHFPDNYCIVGISPLGYYFLAPTPHRSTSLQKSNSQQLCSSTWQASKSTSQSLPSRKLSRPPFGSRPLSPQIDQYKGSTTHLFSTRLSQKNFSKRVTDCILTEKEQS